MQNKNKNISNDSSNLIHKICQNTQETKELAYSVVNLFEANDVIVLSGDLGAGKTQFVQGIANALNINAQIISPTFNILLEYDVCGPEKFNKLYHFDLYRLDGIEELDDIGFFDVIESGGISFIEWGEKFLGAMPESYWHINIDKVNENTREITIERTQNN